VWFEKIAEKARKFLRDVLNPDSGIFLGWETAIYIAISVIISVASYMYQRSVMQSQAARARRKALKSAGYLVNTRDTQVPIMIVYGRHKIGCNQVFIEVKEDTTLCFLAALCEGPIEEITTTASCGGINIWLGEKHLHLFHGFHDSVLHEYENFNYKVGWYGQPKLPVYTWSSLTDDCMRYTAYMGFRLHWHDEDDFSSLGGFPNVTAEIKGLKIIDPRVDMVTLAYSDNPALVIFDLMVNERYGGGIPTDFFHLESVKDAATWCEAKGYHFNGVIYEQDYLLDVVSLITDTFRMAVIFSEGLFKFVCIDEEVPIMTFTEAEIRADSFRVIVPSASNVPTTVRMKFPNANNYYSMEDFVLPGSIFIAAEGENREKEISTLGITSYALAQKLAPYQLERAYYCNQYQFVVGMKGYPLEAGDVVAVSHSVAGWTPTAAQSLRIVSVQYMPNGEVNLVGIPEHSSIYDDVVNSASEETYTTVLPGHDPGEDEDPIPSPTDVAFIVEDVWQGDAMKPRIKGTFTLPEYARSVEVWYSPDGITWGQLSTGNTTGFFHYLPFYFTTHHYKLLTVMADYRRLSLADAPDRIVMIGGGSGGGPGTGTILVAEILAAGDFVNVYDDAGVTRVRLADRDSIDRVANGFVNLAYAVGDMATVHGINEINTFVVTVDTTRYFIGDDGDITDAWPIVDGQVNQELGVAIGVAELPFTPNHAVIIHPGGGMP
jgi:hypothetical protein